ncbi:MAG: hypothetical protein GXP10_03015 [Gammaproteobacteria bacterium]|nr:hypothetical protein [Gammaproteobacteria bacterium]
MIKSLESLCYVVVVAAALSGAAYADDRLELEGATIFGNRELPKAQYIIPWKSSPLSPLAGKPTESLLDDDFLTPLDREVFKRQIAYYKQLHSDRSVNADQ